MKKTLSIKLSLFAFSLLWLSSSVQAKVTQNYSLKEFLTINELSKAARLLYTRPKVNALSVTATAYTSHVGQTDSTPNIAAWGDRLRPGMKVIAVSRDLLNTYGLKHGTKVKIRGLSGEYEVLDKMNRRWRRKIDIYMGKNKHKAFKWGRRKVVIEWPRKLKAL